VVNVIVTCCSCKSPERINRLSNPNPRRVISHTLPHIRSTWQYVASDLTGIVWQRSVRRIMWQYWKSCTFCQEQVSRTHSALRMSPTGIWSPVITSQETHYICATEPSRLMLCKIWGFHSLDYEGCLLLICENKGHTSQETHYVSATESSWLKLCKIWSFHGGDYEECRLLGYKTPVFTSQETHYVSATESSWLKLCKIWSFHGGDYEECRLLGCYAVWLLKTRKFRGDVSQRALDASYY
jgi:hypothetical protein